MKSHLQAITRRPLLIAGFFVLAGAPLSPANAQNPAGESFPAQTPAPATSISAPVELAQSESTPVVAPDAFKPVESLEIESLEPYSAQFGKRDVREIELPSELPSGDARNDRIWFRWYPAQTLTAGPTPAVLLLHPLGRGNQSPMHQYARYLAARGIAAAVLTLPYHGRRRPDGDGSIRHFVNPNAVKVMGTLKQSVSDARTVITWMSAQPEVNPEKIGGIGVSIGAIILHLVMGQDDRVKAGVAALGGGALAESYRNSPLAQSKLLFRLFTKSSEFGKVDPESFQLLDQVDPITYAANNRPRHVLMIEAARDVVVPPDSAEALWNALGRPPIQWVDTNHFSVINLGSNSVMRAAVPYLQSVWNDKPLEAADIPTVHAPTLKVGLVMNLDSIVTPAVQWQFFKLGTHHHRALLNANLGMSGRGPFIGVAATVTPYLDIGAARRFAGNRIRPYASLHFVY